MGKVVVCSGGFDPLHIGHLRHFEKAKALGDKLVVLVNSDDFLMRKKGYIFMPLPERMGIIKALRCVDDVVAVIDKDQTVAETLRVVKPDIFAKGGDRNPDQNSIPEEEIQACQEIGCEIIYGIGEQLNSSSKLVKRIINESS